METENAYYVMHPSLGATAVVYAPATEKARTTFLDWLERNHLMKRSDRQQIRKDMVAQKLDDPNVQSDVVLHYDYVHTAVVGQFPQEATLEGAPQRGLEEEVGEQQVVSLPIEEEKAMMPIQKVMLRGFG